MVEVSRSYLSGADNAVKMRRAAFVDKGTQPELRHNKSEIVLQIGISDLLYGWLLSVQTYWGVSMLLYILHALNRT